jgi:hypothetical protein
MQRTYLQTGGKISNTCIILTINTISHGQKKN